MSICYGDKCHHFIGFAFNMCSHWSEIKKIGMPYVDTWLNMISWWITTWPNHDSWYKYNIIYHIDAHGYTMY